MISALDSSHYGQTRIQPMRLDTKGFLIDSFLCKRDKTFFLIKSIGAIVKINGKAIVSHNMHFLVNCHTVALEAVEVKIKVL